MCKTCFFFVSGTSLTFLLLFFYRDIFLLDLGFGLELGDNWISNGKCRFLCSFVLETLLTFLSSIFFRGHLLDLDFGMDYERFRISNSKYNNDIYIFFYFKNITNVFSILFPKYSGPVRCPYQEMGGVKTIPFNLSLEPLTLAS